jgi:TRAP-type C4-dicarboxylate transport system permease small subunit
MGSIVMHAAAWVQRRAENLIALLLGIMFLAFIIQIVFRYFLNLPTGWTTELSLIAWLWLVLLGGALALKESDEIRLDLVTSAVGARARRVLQAVMCAATVAVLLLALPGSYNYVSFMKVERSSYLGIRLDALYSVFVIFLVVLVVRYAWLLWQALRGDSQVPAAQEGTAP